MSETDDTRARAAADRSIDKMLGEARKESAQQAEENARLRAALGVAEEAIDFAVGALGDAVADMLDKSAGYAVIRMGKDALRLHIKPALRAPGQP